MGVTIKTESGLYKLGIHGLVFRLTNGFDVESGEFVRSTRSWDGIINERLSEIAKLPKSERARQKKNITQIIEG